MIWDMSQVYANSGFLNSVSSDLGLPPSGGGGGGTTTTTTKTSTPTTLTTVTKTTASATATPTGSGTVAQWGQVSDNPEGR